MLGAGGDPIPPPQQSTPPFDVSAQVWVPPLLISVNVSPGGGSGPSDGACSSEL